MTSEPRELIVVGGGIGGAAAALRAAQYLLPTAWVLGDKGTAKASRGKYVYNIDNMIGVHPDLVLEKVRKLLEDQPEALSALDGAHFQVGTQEIIENAVSRVRSEFSGSAELIEERAVAARKEQDLFIVELASGASLQARNLVLSTGVMDLQPSLKKTLKSGRVIDDVRWIYPYANLERFLYCVRCEGHLTRDVPVVVIGASETTAQVAMMLHERYGGRPVLASNGEALTLREETRRLLEAFGAEIIEERIVDVFDEPEGGEAVEGPKGSQMHGLVFESGRRLAARYAMVSMGLFRVYNDLARELGAELEPGDASVEKKHVLVDDHTSETSVPGLFCVGDMAKRRDGGPLMKQVYTAQEYAVRAVDTLERRARAERRRRLLASLD
jgi:thioredoxin reductase (NADPH)